MSISITCEPNNQLVNVFRKSCFWPLKSIYAPSKYLLTVRMRYFCCGSLLLVFDICFVSPYECTDCFSSVLVAVLSPFGKELTSRLTLCSLCLRSICNLSYFLFWFCEQDFHCDFSNSWPLCTCCFQTGRYPRPKAIFFFFFLVGV